MPDPIYVRSLTEEEEEALEKALRSERAFVLRRAQIVRLSAREKRAPEIADQLGCTAQTVRNGIHDFNEEGIESLHPGKPGPKDPDRIFGEKKREALLDLAHQSPRDFSKERSGWSLQLLAEVAFEEGVTDHVVSDETMLATRPSAKRFSRWATAGNAPKSGSRAQIPNMQYALKKSSETV